MADGPLATVRHHSSISTVTLATIGLLYHLSCAQVWFLEALRPRRYILVSVYHFPTDQSQLDQYPEYHQKGISYFLPLPGLGHRSQVSLIVRYD